MDREVDGRFVAVGDDGGDVRGAVGEGVVVRGVDDTEDTDDLGADGVDPDRDGTSTATDRRLLAAAATEGVVAAPVPAVGGTLVQPPITSSSTAAAAPRSHLTGRRRPVSA